MSVRRLRIVGLVLLGLLFPLSAVADGQRDQPLPLLHVPVPAGLRETATTAVVDWCGLRSAPPALLLLSQNPFLAQVPTLLRERVSAVLARCEAGPLKEATASGPAPLLLPNMALGAALEAGFFSQLIWVLPQRSSDAELSVEVFKAQLLESGAATQEEVDSFAATGDAFVGRLRGIPVRAIPWTRLSRLSEPVAVHIDVSFFSRLYQNEIKTPLYPLIYQSLASLRELQLKVWQVSVSRGNLDGSLPLATRFVGDLVVALLQSPELLDGRMPINWQRYNDALYLENFFQNDKTLDLYRQIEKEEPGNAAVKYAIYQNLRRLKQGSEALEALRQAVAIDPVYGLEYLSLVATALDKQLPDQALQMIDLAIAALPANPLLRLQKAELLIQSGQGAGAVGLLDALLGLSWSDVYYPAMAEYLKTLKKAAAAVGNN